jgi:hypothetical protein
MSSSRSKSAGKKTPEALKKEAKESWSYAALCGLTIFSVLIVSSIIQIDIFQREDMNQR